jgi:hypothetical protein
MFIKIAPRQATKLRLRTAGNPQSKKPLGEAR